MSRRPQHHLPVGNRLHRRGDARAVRSASAARAASVRFDFTACAGAQLLRLVRREHRRRGVYTVPQLVRLGRCIPCSWRPCGDLDRLSWATCVHRDAGAGRQPWPATRSPGRSRYPSRASQHVSVNCAPKSSLVFIGWEVGSQYLSFLRDTIYKKDGVLSSVFPIRRRRKISSPSFPTTHLSRQKTEISRRANLTQCNCKRNHVSGNCDVLRSRLSSAPVSPTDRPENVLRGPLRSPPPPVRPSTPDHPPPRHRRPPRWRWGAPLAARAPGTLRTALHRAPFAIDPLAAATSNPVRAEARGER